MRALDLVLKFEWFDEIIEGVKTEEYRLYNDHWTRRLIGKHYDIIRLRRGYTSTVHELPYRGYTVKTITHLEWGMEPRKVFAIKLKGGWRREAHA